MIHRLARTTSLLLLFTSVFAYGKDIQAKLRWQDLPSSLSGQKVRVVCRGQSPSSGLLQRIEPNQLILKTRSGITSIPRQTIDAIETQGKLVRSRHRIIDTAIGGGLGSVVLGIALVYQHNEGGVNTGSIVAGAGIFAAGTTAAGYFIGRASDSDRTIIQIVP